MEYRSNILYKTAKADESEEEGVEEDNTDNQGVKVYRLGYYWIQI